MLRKFLALLLCGPLWFAGMNLFFVYSGAQNILANPRYQSRKFIDVFMAIEPLPRMAADPWLVLKGLFICGILLGGVLIFLNDKLKGGWLRKGLIFGIITWALMIPGFELYLPYNVMHEPFALVLFEFLLWLCVMLWTGICVSFTLNFRKENKTSR